MLPGVMLMFIGIGIWIRLTILSLVVRFVSRSWYAGKADYDNEHPRYKSLCSNNRNKGD